MSKKSKRLLREFSLPIVKYASRAYVAGPWLEDALTICRQFSGQGIAATIGYWNREEDSVRQVTNSYLTAIWALQLKNIDGYLSIKAPALGFRGDLISEIIDLGRQTGIGIHFDALEIEAADRTFDLIRESVRTFSGIGCTLPGRWQRSVGDAGLAIDLGLNVRVVKGQWVDPKHPEIDMRQGFLSVVEALAGRARHVAVATHDPPLARQALRRLLDRGTHCELELLFGLPLQDAIRVAKEEGVKVRLYVPYGESWLPYALSQIIKHPRRIGWLVRDILHSPKHDMIPKQSATATAIPGLTIN